MINYFTPKDIIKIWKDMGKGTKIFFIILLFIAFATMGIMINMQGLKSMEEETQTETCQIALDYLMNHTYEVQEKYAPDELPKLIGISKRSQAGEDPDHIKYLFAFHSIPFTNIGDKYTVELRKENHEWIVVQVRQGSHMKMSFES